MAGSERNYEIGTIRAKSVIGCKIDQSKLFVKKKVRTFDHNYPESREFAGTRKLWTTISVPIPHYDADEWPRRIRLTHELSVRLVEAESGELIAVAFDSDGEVQVMSTSLKKAKVMPFPDGFDVATTKKYLKERLGPLGLWDEKSFGLWCIIACQ